MSDKEMLELAAKAVGRELYYNYLGSQDCNRAWHPLDSLADAFRLAMSLNMTISTGPCEAIASTPSGMIRGRSFKEDTLFQGQAEAVMRVIVRAAAEVGESMP